MVNYWRWKIWDNANYILKNSCYVHATDISDKLLKIGSEKGFIKSYSQKK